MFKEQFCIVTKLSALVNFTNQISVCVKMEFYAISDKELTRVKQFK